MHMSKHATILVPVPTGLTDDTPDAVATPAQLTSIWNAACGEALSISARAMAYNLRPSTGVEQALCVATVDDAPVGFILMSRMADRPNVVPPTVGWCNALAVQPNHRNQGIGSALLAWGEAWLRTRGCAHYLLGGSIRPFAPGLPLELENDAFFRKREFFVRPGADVVWDVAADLAAYQTPPQVQEVDGHVQAARPADIAAIRAFFAREFPGRWGYEFEEFLHEGGRISDFMLLWTADGVDGFCRLTFEDSVRPMERFFPYSLPRPWGQLGPIGVSERVRGRGYGAAVLDAGLRRLHNNGVNGCVIDWTDIVDFYGKFGFARYRAYQQLVKTLLD